jgi:hypothetical protein
MEVKMPTVVEQFTTEKLNLLKEEVKEYNNKILELCKCDEKIKKLYKGCQIFMSPVFYKPKLLFLGINPGSGYYRANNELLKRFEPLSKQDTKYEPWIQIQKCFGKIGKKDWLDTIVKTNYFFFSTYNEKELEIFFEMLPIEFRFELFSKAEEWIKTIITETAPANIICGGFSAARKLKSLYPEYESLERSSNNSVGKIKDIKVFTYSRRFSFMRNRNEYIRYLEKYLNEI